ncbi:MAG: MOSC domain-containing protein, partial [Gammaproteobacteria bacterium]
TALIGRAARLWPVQPAEDVAFYKRYKPDEAQFMQEMAAAFAREPGEPMPDLAQFPAVLMDHVAVPGTFFDNEEIHVLTTASLAHMQALEPDANWDVRRFRPNFLIETAPAPAALVENDWVGRRLRIGTLELEVSAPTPRCGMTVRPQGDLAYDRLVLRTIVREAAQCLGVGAHCRVAGRVCEGDTVTLLD